MELIAKNRIEEATLEMLAEAESQGETLCGITSNILMNMILEQTESLEEK